jgi:D-amino-acid dehydrogenase
VVTAAGSVEADVAVIAAGSWSGRVARSLGFRLPIEGGKGYIMELVGDELPALRRPVILMESVTAITSLERRLRVAGVMAFEGLDDRIDERRLARMRNVASRVVPCSANARVLRTWSGLRPCTPDGLPLVGWLCPGIAVATGHARLGLTTGPGTGELVADLVEGRANELLQPLDPRRYRRSAA